MGNYHDNVRMLICALHSNYYKEQGNIYSRRGTSQFLTNLGEMLM